MRFRNRHDAGQLLAEVLRAHIRRPAIVYALPRGGVPVAAEIARICELPLDLVIARKVGHPMQPEYAVCAVPETGEPVCNADERRRLDPAWLEQRIAAERAEARRRRERYAGGQPRPLATGKDAVVVDDGIATGLSMEAALSEIRADRPARLIVAVPVAPPDTVTRFRGLCDEVLAVDVPEYFLGAVGAYYTDFRQLTDEDVIEELARFRRAAPSPVPGT